MQTSEDQDFERQSLLVCSTIRFNEATDYQVQSAVYIVSEVKVETESVMIL